MKKAAVLFASFVLMIASPLSAAELQRNTGQDFSPQTIPPSASEFAKVIDDLPLMPGLQLIDDDDVLFTSESGRIAETTAEGEVDIDDMYMFYRRSLPQLGWKPLDMRSYRRDNEVLRIDAHAEDKRTTVQFSVTPVGK